MIALGFWFGAATIGPLAAVIGVIAGIGIGLARRESKQRADIRPALTRARARWLRRRR